MSFSREVKDEILEKISLDMSGKRRAFISGIFRNCGSVAIISNVKKIVFELGNAVIAMQRRIFRRRRDEYEERRHG